MAGINEAWRSTCKIILGQEVGELSEFEGFLKRYSDPIKKAKSGISGKEVYYGAPYCQNTKFISHDEIGQMKVEPIGIDDTKDIDSLLNAVAERFRYAGNKIGGQTHDIVASEDCADAFYVLESQDIFRSEYVAYGQMLADLKYMFGCTWGASGLSSFAINCTEIYNMNRAFECTIVVQSSDAHYSYNCNGCHEILFCINQKSIRNAIGNNQLPKEKYLELKKKLLAEIADGLKKKKTAPSLMDVMLGKV